MEYLEWNFLNIPESRLHLYLEESVVAINLFNEINSENSE